MAFVPFHLANITSVCLFFFSENSVSWLPGRRRIGSVETAKILSGFMKSVIRWGIGGLGAQQALWSLALAHVRSRLVI